MSEAKGLDRGLTNYGDPRFRALPAPFDGALDGPVQRVAEQAHHRHRDFALRVQQLPPLHAAARGSRIARRAGGRRPAARVPDDLAGRSVPEPDQHGVPQPDVDGRRGDDPRAADGRGGAHRRLRQDRAGAVDGSRVRWPAGDPARHRPDDDRTLQGRAARRLHRLSSLLGEVSRRRDRRRRSLAGGRAACNDGRHVRRDGHGEHDGVHHRGARHRVARNGGDSRRGFATAGRGGRDRQDGSPARPRADHAGSDHHARVGRERVSPADGARRLDERHHSPDRCRRPSRHSDSARSPERDLRRNAGARRPEAGRRRLHGRLVRGGRGRGRAARVATAIASGLSHGRGNDVARATRPAGGLGRSQRDPRVRHAGVEGGRPDRAARQSRAGRCDLQAGSRNACIVRSRGPRRRVREPGGSVCAHRRSGAGRRAQTTFSC